ncbi:hypothetical protein [Aeromonas hydrophila]|uniref:hypothetical protein n=1 Tax=Aeromonas hydrophila TaxID=644 RepID=UPI003D196821
MSMTSYQIIQRAYTSEIIIPQDQIPVYFNIYDPDQLVMVESFIDAGVSIAERYCNRAIVPTDIEMVRQVKSAKTVKVPFGAYEIKSVSVNGTAVTDFEWERITNTITFQVPVSGKVRVTAICGFKEGIPSALKIGIIQFAAGVFMNRESMTNGFSASEIPFSFRVIFDQWNLPVSDIL